MRICTAPCRLLFVWSYSLHPQAAWQRHFNNACLHCTLQAIEFGQYEEAFEIYKKFGKKVEAVQVLLTHCKDLDRAHDYANKVRQCFMNV
jgi:hypothetical protein